MCVEDGDLVSSSGGFGFSGEETVDLLWRNADAVIGEKQNHRFVLDPAGEDDGALAAVLFQDAVQDAVLDDGLKGQPGNPVLHHGIRYVDYKVDAVVEAHVLKAYVNGSVFDLLLERADGVLAAERQTVESGEIADRLVNFLGAALLRHPVDHLHGVVQKMGIDLGLQRAEFGDSELLGLLLLLVHQVVDLSCHVVVGVDQVANFVIFRGRFHGNRGPVLYPAHLPTDRADPVREGAGKEICEKNSDDGSCGPDKDKPQPVDQGGFAERSGGRDAHQKPVRGGKIVVRDIYRFAEDFFLQETV